jgi:phage replication O-like protein O
MSASKKPKQISEKRDEKVNRLGQSFTQLPHSILENLAMVNLTGAENQCLFAIFRKTYGYNKKQDIISRSQFEKMTGLHNWSVTRALTKLSEKNIIHTKKISGYKGSKKNKTATGCEIGKKQNRNRLTRKNSISYCFNEDFNTWRLPTKKQKKHSKSTESQQTIYSTTLKELNSKSYTRACAGENFICPSCDFLVPGGLDVCPRCSAAFDEIWDEVVEVKR